MHYEIEELIPVVGKLAEKYTSGESTSISYERAELLMEAVLYCIHELEQNCQDSLTLAEKMPAQKAYDLGADCVEKKTRQALKLYHELLLEFDNYGNKCLYHVFTKEMPEFFKRYDVRFAPQDTILSLDYPVEKDISVLTGIDNIFEFLFFIQLEQRFLKKFSRDFCMDAISAYSFYYKEMTENICVIVFEAALRQLLEKSKDSYERIFRILLSEDLPEIENYLKNAAVHSQSLWR